jgi:hypothetical protein
MRVEDIIKFLKLLIDNLDHFKESLPDLPEYLSSRMIEKVKSGPEKLFSKQMARAGNLVLTDDDQFSVLSKDNYSSKGGRLIGHDMSDG